MRFFENFVAKADRVHILESLKQLKTQTKRHKMNATKYILAIHANGKKEFLTEARATEKWEPLAKELAEFGYVVPVDRLYPCLYTVESFAVNGKKTKILRSVFVTHVGELNSFFVTANRADHSLPVSALIPAYSAFNEAKREKACKLQKELDALRKEIEDHDDRLDRLHATITVR